jgi:hypothetical protein
MELAPPVNHVFVDFENVHEVDLSVIGSEAVTVTLLVGARQTKLDTVLVEKLLQHASSVQLVRLTSSGRNALDFSLAYYLGRAVAADPTGHFHIISKDTGYDALVAHLREKHIHVHRHVDFAALPFSGPVKVVPTILARSPTLMPAGSTALPKPKKVPKLVVPVLDERASRVLEHLSDHPKNRPSREKTLIRHIVALFGNKIAESDATTVIETLRQHGYVEINEKGGVKYQLPDPVSIL